MKNPKNPSSYECESCKMSVKALECAHCGAKLEHATITGKNGDVDVCQCPKGCGKIKSPTCCGHDMKPKA